MRTKYEEILDKMYFEIGSTLIDNDCCRKGIMMSKPLDEEEIVRSNRRTYMNLKVYMMRLERSLFGGQNEQALQEISSGDVGESEVSSIRRKQAPRKDGDRGTDR